MTLPSQTQGDRRERILVYVGGELLGDGLNKLPFLRALRRAYPHAWITWFAGSGPTAYTGKLAPAVSGLIDEIVGVEHGQEAWANVLRPRLGNRRFDVIIDTKRKLRATVELRRIPHGVFVSGTVNGLLSQRRAPGQPLRRAKPAHFLDQLLQLLSLARYARVDGPVDPSGRVEVAPRCREAAAALVPERNGVILAPGAGGAKKRWPWANFVAVAHDLQRRGYTPVIALGPGEESLHAELAQSLPDASFPLQAASVEARADEPFLTMAIAQRARAALANDSGNAHILAAAGVPLVVLFGATSAEKFAPPGAHVQVVRAGDYGDSLADLPVRAVASALLATLGETGAVS
jgi:ADP-heptose:LPS heptosyltransferase